MSQVGSSANRFPSHQSHERQGNTVPLPGTQRGSLTAAFQELTERRFTCPNCHNVNAPGLIVCANCGIFLFGRAGKTNKLDMDVIFATPLEEQPTGEEYAAGQHPIFVEIDGQCLALPVRESLVIGRLSPVPGDPKPDIRLNKFSADELGVSRQHLKITLQGGETYVADLGSSNGTFLNGRRLRPNQNYVLRSGDELRLGHLRLWVRF